MDFTTQELFHIQNALGEYIGSCSRALDRLEENSPQAHLIHANIEKLVADLRNLLDKVRFQHKLSHGG